MEGAAGEDKLKAEFAGGDAIGGEDRGLLGAAEGIERSSRSLMPEARGAGFAGAVGDVNDDKSPNPPVLDF